MTVIRLSFLYLSVLIFFPFQSTLAQVVFRELPKSDRGGSVINYIDESAIRTTLHLSGKWNVYFADDSEKIKTGVTVPSLFEGNAELIFEKSFEIDYKTLSQNNFEINFLGLNYSAEISINKSLIYRHTGGEFPFSFLLPKDILHHDKRNTLSIKIVSNLDSENTIPVKQRFLAPKHLGGIFRDVFIRIIPNIYVGSLNTNYKFVGGQNKVKLTVNTKIENKDFRKITDSSARDNSFDVRFTILMGKEKSVVATSGYSIQISRGKEKIASQNFEFSPSLWSPESPEKYLLQVQIQKNGILIDEISKEIIFYSLRAEDDSLYLNGSAFMFRGVTYIPSNGMNGSMMSYQAMEKDIKIIKETGFNSVRFAGTLPHPYLLTLCQNAGLFAFVEMPLNSIPDGILGNQLFLDNAHNYLSNFIDAYSEFYVIAAIGLGSGYDASSEVQQYFLKELSSGVKRKNNFLLYASFNSFSVKTLPGIDLYGIEFFNSSPLEKEEIYFELKERIGQAKVFISEAGYTANLGSSSGYTNPFTFEAQAKYFGDLITYSEDNYHAGYFLHSMFDYRSDYQSIVSGDNNQHLVLIGILGENRSTDRLTYKVINSKLNNLERVTIPLGISKNDSPMIFIIYGLVLALVMGFLVNSGRKFREDTSRALLRPYNFYADIRDMRMISGLHTTGLALLVSASLALITSSVLYNWKKEIIYEKILLSFGSDSIMSIMSFLSWQPPYAIGILTILFFIMLLFISLVVKLGSLFVMNRVFLTNSFFMVAWSFVPVVLTIPLAIVLYRILNADIISLYIYILLIFLFFWILYRILKGMYVIYDVQPAKLYFYSFVVLVGGAGVILFYYQSTALVIDYFFHYLKQIS